MAEGNGKPLQCPCLENPGDRGAWWAAVYGVAQSRTGLTRPSSSALRQRPPGPCTSSPSTIQATSAVPRGKPLLAAVATSRRFHHDRPEASHPPPPSLLRGCGCWPGWRRRCSWACAGSPAVGGGGGGPGAVRRWGGIGRGGDRGGGRGASCAVRQRGPAAAGAVAAAEGERGGCASGEWGPVATDTPAFPCPSCQPRLWAAWPLRARSRAGCDSRMVLVSPRGFWS